MNNTKQKILSFDRIFVLVGEGGFEPPKAEPTDLQSAPFGHSGTLPGAGDGTRTRDLLITNQLLYQLSYTSKYSVTTFHIIKYYYRFVNTLFYQKGGRGDRT